MFREMRRKNQQLPQEEALDILKKSTSGVLAVLGDEGYPYAVPLSYVYSEGKLYFHCAASGHKLDAVRGCNKASFCIISEDNVIPEKYTTAFRSVIAFGRVRELVGEELQTAMRALAGKYSPAESEESFQKEMSDSMSHLCVLALDIEHLSGKEGRELMMKRRS